MNRRRDNLCEHRSLADRRRFDCDKPGLLAASGRRFCGKHLHAIASNRARMAKVSQRIRERHINEQGPGYAFSNYILRKAPRRVDDG